MTDWRAEVAQEERAQELFLELLNSDPKETYGQFRELRGELVAQRLLFGDKPVPLIFSPVVISRARWTALCRTLDQLNRILADLEPKLNQKKWLDRLGFETGEKEWIQIPNQLNPGYSVSRIDGFLDEKNSYKIVELNVDSPGGAAFLDASSRAVMRTPVWREFQQRCPGETVEFQSPLFAHLERVWTQFLAQNPSLSSPGGKPRIAIVDWVTVSTHREFELLAEGLEKRGYDTVVADPRELSYSLGRLRCYDGKPIDLLYRRVLVEDMLRDRSGSEAILEACRAGTVCMINSFASKPLTVKSLLALFHDPLAEELLSDSHLEFLRNIIPLTLCLTEQHRSQVIEQQERFVLKPADGWGAHGLYLGWRCTKQEWKEHVARSLAVGGYVAQERVHIPTRSLPTWTGEKWECFNYRFDLSPYGLGEQSVSPMVRLSPSEVLNVKRGAQIAAVWVQSQPPHGGNPTPFT